MTDRELPLGVFDSGVGGLTVVAELRRRLPQEDILYLGDTARVPYGSKPAEMIRSFASEIADELLERGVKGIVVACNTASAIALPALADALPVPVWGVIEPGIRAARARTLSGSVAVLGTVATVRSLSYQRGLSAAGLRVWAKACPLFVPIVEEGVADGEIARLVADHYLSQRPEVDTVILGCTHYPMLKDTLRQVLGDEIALVDSAAETALTVARDLEALELLSTRAGGGRLSHLVTGDIESYRHTAELLGADVAYSQRVHLEGSHESIQGAGVAG